MTILDQIAQTKREEVVRAQSLVSLSEQRKRATDARATSPSRDFIAPFLAPKKESPRIIAEIKKASPSAGVIRADFNPVAIAEAYARAGASALSILTDRDYFQGDLAYLAEVKAVVDLPILRKDFMVDVYQIYESRVAGADAILLIAMMLSRGQMEAYLGVAGECGLSVLIELHDEDDLKKVTGLSGRYLLGVNNRDLKTFAVSLEVSKRLAKAMPAEIPWISESGIRSRAEMDALSVCGFSGFLVGESLMREADIEAALRQLICLDPSV